MSNNLINKVCVITGGASGIGLGIADCFLQNGAKTVIILDIEHVSEAVETLRSKYRERVVYYKCDVTKDSEEVWTKLVTTYKTTDVLVNNAGVIAEEDPRKTIEVNTLAGINLSLKFWEYTRTDKGGNGGTILNIASVNGYRFYPYIPMYNTSKCALIGFTKSFGHPYNFNKFGVRSVVLCPGVTTTNLSGNSKPWSGDNGDFIEALKLLPMQEVQDVAKAALEVFENAESGTAWEIEGARPIVEV